MFPSGSCYHRACSHLLVNQRHGELFIEQVSFYPKTTSQVFLAILSSKNLLHLRSSNVYMMLITSLVAADGLASALLGGTLIYRDAGYHLFFIYCTIQTWGLQNHIFPQPSGNIVIMNGCAPLKTRIRDIF